MNTFYTRRNVLSGIFCTSVLGITGCHSFTSSLRKDESLVAFLSDCHVGNWKSTKYQGEKFTECLARVLTLDPLPSRIIISGDIAYLWGRKEDYALSKKLLEPVFAAGIEVTLAMGNHDRRENFLEFWPEYASRSPVKDRIVSVVRSRHFDYLVIDSLDQPEATDKWITPGTLDGIQREWLKAACREAKRPFFVVAHHPACELGAKGDKQSRANARDFGELIMGAKDAPTKCCGFIHGHNHEWHVTRSLCHWGTGRLGHTVCLPSTGHWGDIGFSLMRETPDHATLTLSQYDFFTPKPLPIGAAPRADWQAVVHDKNGSQLTFVV